MQASAQPGYCSEFIAQALRAVANAEEHHIGLSRSAAGSSETSPKMGQLLSLSGVVQDLQAFRFRTLRRYLALGASPPPKQTRSLAETPILPACRWQGLGVFSAQTVPGQRPTKPVSGDAGLAGPFDSGRLDPNPTSCQGENGCESVRPCIPLVFSLAPANTEDSNSRGSYGMMKVQRIRTRTTGAFNRPSVSLSRMPGNWHVRFLEGLGAGNGPCLLDVRHDRKR